MNKCERNYSKHDMIEKYYFLIVLITNMND